MNTIWKVSITPDNFFVFGILWGNAIIIVCLIRNDGDVQFTGNIHQAYHKVNAAIAGGGKSPFLGYKLKYDMLIASCYYNTAYEKINYERWAIIMSLPEFPTSTPPLSREEAINQIISSIAMEELGLSHIINAEGEKLQYILGTLSSVTGPRATIDDVLKVNESVRAVLQGATESQTLLRSKLHQALNSGVLTGPTGPRGQAGPVSVDVAPNILPAGPDGQASVENIGDTRDVMLEFTLPRGPTGAAGATGATGTFAAYGTYISIGTGTGGVAVNSLIQWSNVLSEEPVGMGTTTSPSTTVTLTNAGVYRIDYRIIVALITGTDNASIELELNGIAVPNSAVLLTNNIEISGVAVVSTAANTTVALRVIGNNITMPLGTNAFLDIIKIA